MTITREIDGKSVQLVLTEDELYEAFEEQQHKFDVEDIRNYFDGLYEEGAFETEYGRSYSEIEAMFDDLACEMRRNIDHYNMDWMSAREEAIEELLRTHTAV